jgi:hypothetical protein
MNQRSSTTPNGRIRMVRAFLLTPVHWFGHLIAFMAVTVFLVRVFPFHMEMWAEEGRELPAAAQAMTALSHLFVRSWYLFGLALVVFDAPLLFLLNSLPERRAWIGRLWFSLWLLLALLFLTFCNFILSMPPRGTKYLAGGPRQHESRPFSPTPALDMRRIIGVYANGNSFLPPGGRVARR